MSEERLLESWNDNAASWTRMVRHVLLSSRVLVTDQAVLDAVGTGGEGEALLDLGCREGWLCHRLAALGWEVVGTDAVLELVKAARAGGPGEFLHLAYEQLDDGLAERRFQTVVANFSLLGEASVGLALASAWRVLLPRGRLVVQTLHPLTISPYLDGWRKEDWSAMGDHGCVATPWYFRTLESWCSLLSASGFQLLELREPKVAGALVPSSLLLVASR